MVFHVSLIFKKVGEGTGRGAYSKGRLFDIMVLGVGAHLGEARAQIRALALIQAHEIFLQLQTSKFVFSHPLT